MPHRSPRPRPRDPARCLRQAAAPALLGALLSLGAGCLETWDLGPGGSGGDGGLDGATCLGSASPCAMHRECCSGLCDITGGEQGLCRPADLCLPEAAPCLFSSSCCGLRCAQGVCGAETGQCEVSGVSCQDGEGCCSGLCQGSPTKCKHLTVCRGAGDDCNSGGECCAGLCVELAESGNKRCARLPGCRVEGELCEKASLCCTGACAPDVDGLARCVPPADTPDGCAPTGELCSRQDHCCSGLCDNLDGTVSRCQPLGGCRPAGERCQDPLDCCGLDCALASDAVLRCATAAPACLPEGERCAADADCCEPVPNACRPGVAGVDRCLGDPARPCLPAGDPCPTDAACCAGACRLDASGRTLRCTDPAACLPPGDRCTGAAECCDAAQCLAVDTTLRCLAP